MCKEGFVLSAAWAVATQLKRPRGVVQREHEPGGHVARSPGGPARLNRTVHITVCPRRWGQSVLSPEGVAEVISRAILGIPQCLPSPGSLSCPVPLPRASPLGP